MTICPLYQSEPEPQVAVASPRRVEVVRQSKIMSNLVWRMGCAAVFVLLLLYVTISLPLVLVGLFCHVFAFGTRYLRHFAFASSCMLGALTAIFSPTLGTTFICLSLVTRSDSRSTRAMLRLLRSHL